MNSNITIKKEEPAHAESLLSATERTLKHHDLRLKPSVDLAMVVEAIESKGFKLTEQHGYLSAESTGQFKTPAHVNQLFEAVAEKHTDMFFPRDPSGVTGRDQLDQAGKIKFIKEQGLEAFEQLPPTAPKEQVIVLDPHRMNREQWLALDRPTRAQLAGQWGPDAVAQVMNRRAGK